MKPFLDVIQLRLRPLLVVGELMLIAALAFMASRRQLTLVLFLSLGVGLVLTFLRWSSQCFLTGRTEIACYYNPKFYTWRLFRHIIFACELWFHPIPCR